MLPSLPGTSNRTCSWVEIDQRVARPESEQTEDPEAHAFGLSADKATLKRDRHSTPVAHGRLLPICSSSAAAEDNWFPEITRIHAWLEDAEWLDPGTDAYACWTQAEDLLKCRARSVQSPPIRIVRAQACDEVAVVDFASVVRVLFVEAGHARVGRIGVSDDHNWSGPLPDISHCSVLFLK